MKTAAALSLAALFAAAPLSAQACEDREFIAYFPAGEVNPVPEALETIESFARAASDLKATRLRVSGYAAAEETADDGAALARARAQAVAERLQALGVSQNHLVVEGFAESAALPWPLDGETQSAYRRVVILTGASYCASLVPLPVPEPK